MKLLIITGLIFLLSVSCSTTRPEKKGQSKIQEDDYSKKSLKEEKKNFKSWLAELAIEANKPEINFSKDPVTDESIHGQGWSNLLLSASAFKDNADSRDLFIEAFVYKSPSKKTGALALLVTVLPKGFGKIEELYLRCDNKPFVHIGREVFNPGSNLLLSVFTQTGGLIQIDKRYSKEDLEIDHDDAFTTNITMVPFEKISKRLEERVSEKIKSKEDFLEYIKKDLSIYNKKLKNDLSCENDFYIRAVSNNYTITEHYNSTSLTGKNVIKSLKKILNYLD